MKEIKLTKGFVTQVDDDMYDFLMQWKWHVGSGKYPTCVTRDAKFKEGLGKQKIYIHRVIMNTPLELEVDHIDRDPLNNQRSNLRNCTHAENHKNVTPWGDVMYRGVDIRNDQKRKKRFRATININGKQMFLGNYLTAEEAARAYDKAAKFYFKEFAYLNFPNE